MAILCCANFPVFIQVNKNNNEFYEQAEKLMCEEGRISAVLTEWERTCLPPQSEEVCLHNILCACNQSIVAAASVVHNYNQYCL